MLATFLGAQSVRFHLMSVSFLLAALWFLMVNTISSNVYNIYSMYGTSFHEDNHVQFCYWIQVMIMWLWERLCAECFPSNCMYILLNIVVMAVFRLHTQDQDYWCGLQCLQQRAGENQDPGEELHCPYWQSSLQAVVWGSLCHSYGTQEGSKAGKDHLHVTIGSVCVLGALM